MQAVRSGDAIAAVYIPENFERDLLARKRPQVVSLYNRQYFTPGNNAASSISSAISAATAALPHEADERLQAGRPRRRAICPLEPGAELRPVPAAGGSADRAARRHRDRRRLCGRLGVLPAQQARLDARRRRSPAGRAHRQVPALVRHLHRHDGGGRRHHPRPLRGQLPRRPVAGRRVSLPPAHRLSLVWSLAGSADSGAPDRPQPDRAILQSGVRLRRRRLPGRGDGGFPASLGLDPAASLVSADPVRPGGARPAGVGFRQAVHDPRRPRLPLFRARLGEASRHRQCAAETRGDARRSACGTGAASRSRWATRSSAFSATAGSSA